MQIGWEDEATTAIKDDDDRDTKTISFAAGEVQNKKTFFHSNFKILNKNVCKVSGQLVRDRICLGESNICTVGDFVVMTEESDDPFKDADWDGVMGLGD